MAIRMASIVLLSTMVAACGGETESETVSGSGPQTAAERAGGAADASFKLKGTSYELAVVGDCGPAADGTYDTWAMTLDDDGQPLPDGPQLHAMSAENWSVIDFVAGAGKPISRVYREGNETFGFADGVLEFEGELGAGLREVAAVRIVCPDEASQ